MFADSAFEHGLQFVSPAVFDEYLWDLCDEARVVGSYHLPGAFRPGIAQGTGQSL
jgi:hypothetical protein